VKKAVKKAPAKKAPPKKKVVAPQPRPTTPKLPPIEPPSGM
jgi:hypothetical protein